MGAVSILGFGMTPIFATPMPGMQMPVASQTDESQSLRDVDIMSHQHEMQALTASLDKSFQAIVDARDANGYVRDKFILKTHEADIIALRNFVRNQRLFLNVYEHKCGEDITQHDHIVQIQQQLKAVLYDVVDTLSVYQNLDDPSIETSEPLELALDAHREALKQLFDAIAKHEQAITQMMKACTQ